MGVVAWGQLSANSLSATVLNCHTAQLKFPIAEISSAISCSAWARLPLRFCKKNSRKSLPNVVITMSTSGSLCFWATSKMNSCSRELKWKFSWSTAFLLYYILNLHCYILKYHLLCHLLWSGAIGEIVCHARSQTNCIMPYCLLHLQLQEPCLTFAIRWNSKNPSISPTK